ncbi:MAG TPA: VCBS repeat-containing protein, partial [Pseudonocardiaceae bacterium]
APLGGRTVADGVPAKQATSAGTGGIGTANASGRAGDLSLDGIPDIVARNRNTGHLNLYAHSGSYNGLQTFPTVQSTSYGWGGMTWLGTGYVTADNAIDVIARAADGRLLVYPHSGSLANYPVITPPTVLGYGWGINDLITVDDWNADGYDDILGRRAGTGDVYLYQHSGTFNGTSTYPSAGLVLTGAELDVWQAFGDFTGDGVTDLVYKDVDGFLGVYDFLVDSDPGTPGPEGQNYYVGYGWNINDRLLLMDVDGNGYTDVLARNGANGNLVAYTHSGTWDTTNPYGSLQSPSLLGYGWTVNDIIT